MSPLETILLVGIVFLIVLMLGHPLTFTLGGLAILFGFTLWGNPNILNLFARSVFNIAMNIVYVCVPLFIFMGAVLERSGAADDLFEAMYVVLGKLKGGLAISTVFICTLLAAATGIIGASITLMTMLAQPCMFRHKYDQGLATGTIMAAGCLGTLIPPSIILIVYGGQAQISIGRLFAGGLGAGLLLASLYIGYIVLRTIINPNIAPAISAEDASKYDISQKLLMTIKSIVPTLGLILIVLGSIMFGIATPTEAAALGSSGAIVVALINRKLNWKMFKECCYLSLKTTSMILWIVMGASMFTAVFMGLGGGQLVTDLVSGLELNKWLILTIILLILFIMGMFIDVIGVLLIGIPIFTPIVYGMGFDPIWFGIVFAIMIQAAYLSPPFAYAAFYLKGASSENIKITLLYKATLPFLILQVIGLIILAFIPEIITWLPNKLFGS